MKQRSLLFRCWSARVIVLLRGVSWSWILLFLIERNSLLETKAGTVGACDLTGVASDNSRGPTGLTGPWGSWISGALICQRGFGKCQASCLTLQEGRSKCKGEQKQRSKQARHRGWCSPGEKEVEQKSQRKKGLRE